MTIKGAEYAVTQITALLQLYLPAELNLIDAEMGDGIILDDVMAYFEYESGSSLVPYDLAIVTNVVSTFPIDIKSTTNSPGVYHAEHRVIVSVHKKDVENAEPDILKKRMLRYARAIERVMAIKYPTGNPANSVLRIQRVDEVTYIDSDQGSGQFVRSATIPFLVTTYENL